MSLTAAEKPHIIHKLPGRVRVHLPGWEGQGQRALEARLRRMQGVSGVRSSLLTRNVLVNFDPRATDDESILAAVGALEPEVGEEAIEKQPEAPPVQRERRGPLGRVRIAVRGLDRDPDLARRVVEHLEIRLSVKVSANQLTGRVLVELDERKVGLEEVLSMVAGTVLPELPGEDRPTHPLDWEPLFEATTATLGAFMGLGLHAARILLGLTGPPVASAGLATAAVGIELLEGFPRTRSALYWLLGERVAGLLFGASSIVLHTLSGNTLGLVVAGAGAFRLLTEVRARREAWRGYEARLETAAPARPGAVIQLDAGEPTPLAATILEGTGTATARDGLPAPVFPGASVGAGTPLHGGPFALELQGHEPFIPEPRPGPESGTLHDRYAVAMVPIMLLFAAATALLTRSLSRTAAALLLVNPRTAEIGRQLANTGASARVLRSGVAIVGTRPDRIVRRPEVLLLDGARVLTDGLEVSTILPQTEAVQAEEILALASGVAAAAGSPWGKAFPTTDRVPDADGAFDGETATAELGGVRYRLGPVAEPTQIPTATRLKEPGCYLLGLHREQRLLGIIALRPRLATGVAELVETCRRRGVKVTLLDGGTVTAQLVARRAGVMSLDGDDAVGAVRDLQRDGEMVALVSDSAHAAAGFAACDLAIGLTSGGSSDFSARADLLASGLGEVAATVEAGARRDAAFRDSVVLSMVANVFGVVWSLRGAPSLEHASHAVYITAPVYATALAAMGDGWARLRGGKRPEC
ncbi:MAG: hypothetical protein JOZ19_15600 [Rubrobacter sp.]|nr:hypothetical protein [Rubrobacter sp.]